MFLPYKDINPSATFPYVTIAIIVANVFVFFSQVSMPGGLVESVHLYGFRPVALLSPGSVCETAVPAILTLFVSMFMHGGLFHIVGNMLYLWIFGDNVEDVMGHGVYLLFYFAGGIIAALAHAFAHPGSAVPVIGASGAVAGVLGAYLVLYPTARVKTLVFIFFYPLILLVPAGLLIGLWILTNLVMGIASLSAPQVTGVAWFAHLGGLAFGIVVGVPFRKKLAPVRRIHARFDRWPAEWRL